MRKWLLLLGAVLALSVNSAAQDGRMTLMAATPAVSPSPAPPPIFGDSGLPKWQLAIGYQYNRINLTGTPFHTNGLNTSFVRFFGSWFGLEGVAGAGFGNTDNTNPPNLTVKSVFAGGGPHLAIRGHRLEPWIHGDVGMEHFRFTQTGNIPPVGILGSNTALGWVGGGGLDFHLNSAFAIRAQADYLGTRFFSTTQRHFQAVGGVVLDF